MDDFIGPAHPAYKSDTHMIGLSGYARSGKDTVADILVEHYGFTKFAFADKLRQCVYELNPIIRADEVRNHPFEGPPMFRYFKDVIDEDGWDGYKDGYYKNDIRRLLQRMGTEVGRDLISDSIWVDELDKHSGKIVVTDCRFLNEAEKIKSKGGTVWRITRPETQPINPHTSEIALDNYTFDQYIDNDSTIAALKIEIDHLMEESGIPEKLL